MRIIAGEWRGRRIAAPTGREVRPTSDRVREAWMSVLGTELGGARILDLYAGSGALGLEALSRGAAHVVFVERARESLAVLRANISLLGASSRCEVLAMDVDRFLRSLSSRGTIFDFALADPPYGRGLAAHLLRHFSAAPYAAALHVEHRSDEKLPELPGLRSRRYGDTILTELPAPADRP